MSYHVQLQKLSQLFKTNIPTLKRLGRAPIGLSKFDYTTEVMPTIGNYMITDKADGIRGIIEFTQDNRAFCIVGSDYFELNEIKGAKQMIVEAEILVDKKIVLIYDIFQLESFSLLNKPFKERYSQLSTSVDKVVHSEWKFKVKQFWTLSTATYAKHIMELYNAMKKYPYNTDGIIFTQVDKPYSNTSHYKWKPPEHLTIDFLIVKGNSGPELWSGIPRMLFKQLGLQLPADYLDKAAKWIKITSQQLVASEFFPIPFTPSSAPNAYRAPINIKHGGNARNINRSFGGTTTSSSATSINSVDDLIGHIIEVSWYNNMWLFHRIRTDRVKELASGHYYGNSFEVAELTFQSVLNPLTIKELVAPLNELTENFYFEKSDDKYRNARNFNNFVKSQLFARNNLLQYAIDMASGKGQDLGRYFTSKIKNVLMLEIDKSAIDELISRKYNISKTQRIDNINESIGIRTPPKSTNITVANMDLNESATKNIKQITDLTDRFRAGNCDLVVCNMALHYMVPDSEHVTNIVSFISHWLKNGGEFMFTALDATKIKNLLKSGSWVAGPYKIEKTSTVNKIAVLLPCSRELREEPLIDLGALDKEFNKHKIIRIETKSFSEYLLHYSKRNQLSTEDIEFTSLYHYCIYKKIE